MFENFVRYPNSLFMGAQLAPLGDFLFPKGRYLHSLYCLKFPSLSVFAFPGSPVGSFDFAIAKR